VYLLKSLDEIEEVAKYGIDAVKLKESLWKNRQSLQ
jgi:hypothetical protein